MKRNKSNRLNKIFFSIIVIIIIIFVFLVVYFTTYTSNKLTTNSQATVINPQPNLIISGQPTGPEKWPFMVFLYNKKDFWTSPSITDGYLIHNLLDVFYCGGTLIAPHWVLTAAHCLYNFKRINTKPRNDTEIVRIKTVDEIGVAVDFYDIQKIIPVNYLNTRLIEIDSIYQPGNFAYEFSQYVYPDFGSTNFLYKNDIALIKLKKDVDLPTISLTNNFSVTLPKNNIFNLGWGMTNTGFFSSIFPSPSILLNGVWLNINQLPLPESSSLQKYYHMFISAGGKNAGSGCFGDSGGPALAYFNSKWFEVGIFSSVPDNSCALSYFTNINGYLNWIYQTSGVKINQGTFAGQLSYAPFPSTIISLIPPN